MRKIDVIAEVTRVLQLEGDAILNAVRLLEDESSDAARQVEKAILCFQKVLAQGGKIIVTGVGKSGKIAQKIAATLSSTGSLAVYLHPTEGLHGDLGLVQAHDAVLALSYTGNTDELVRLMPSVKSRGAMIVGMGGNPASLLATQSHIWIRAEVSAEACPHNLAPTSSTTLALALGDALAMALMRLRGFDASSFAQNHPGGSLGRKLNLKVSDLMHHLGAVPLLPADASMDQVIVSSTQGKLGAVVVVEGSRLIGIITDGDIRRSLQHREKFFQLQAKEVMTHHPITAVSEMMAQTALELMENRVSQISVLPVVDSNGNCLGLIRLHDLVKAF